MQRRFLGLAVITAICAALLLGCSRSTTATSAGSPPAPEPIEIAPDPLAPGMPAFHASLPEAGAIAPGTIVATEPFTYEGPPNRAWRVAYTSRSIDDRPIVVTGLVIIPTGTPPPGGWPVVSWAHGTTGIGDLCAPSVASSPMTPARGMLSAGFALVATDYEGLGTIGRHPYLVGASEARSTLDIALAASRVPDWNLSRRVAVWGHSQGGHAALFTPTIAAEYEPDLALVAVVAGAPPTGLDLLDLEGGASSLRPLTVFVALAFNAIDPVGAPLDAALTETGIEVALTASQFCSAQVHAAVDALPPGAAITKSDPSDDWRALLRANDPLHIETPSKIPTLVIHGSADDLIPVAGSISLLRTYCDIGRPTELWVGEGADHSSIVNITFPMMTRWIAARFAGSDLVPPGPGVTRTTC